MDALLKMQTFVPECSVNTGHMLATVMAHIAAKNADACSPTTEFHCPVPPAIPLEGYLARMEEYMHCSRQCFVIASVLITRVEEATGRKSLITPQSAHRLVLTATVIAAKTNEDKYLDNQYYAEVGGISVQEMNRLELAMLKLVGWNAFVSPEQYAVCNESLSNLYRLVTGSPTPVSPESTRRLRRNSVCVDLVDEAIERRNSVSSTSQNLMEEFAHGGRRRSSFVGSY